ncbi:MULTISPECIES: CD1375 family protein [Enterococcus]|nr:MULTISPECIES: CD1375 family protein [Enterococcus]
MVNVYVSLIQKGIKTIDEVPKQLKKQVQAILAQDVTE